jgi:hypothetical protein
MKHLMYVVTAYRWGSRDEHSYVVGACLKKLSAVKLAEQEETNRGFKYMCEVLEIEDNVALWTKDHKIVRELRQRPL